MELNKSIIKIRVDLQNSSIQKSGKNPHARYGYFELKDFLPKLNELMLLFAEDKGLLFYLQNINPQDVRQYFHLE